MSPTSTTGNQTEGAVLAALIRAGKTVLIPFGGGHRYDIAYEEDEQLVKVQCKTGRIRRGCLIFNTASIDLLSQSRRGYKGHANQFGVHSPELNKVYLVPVAEMPIGEGYLRVEPPRNSQAKRIRWAKEYEI